MSKDIKKIPKDKIKESNNLEYKITYKPKKYHSAFLNTVNRDAHSSRPETVGKLATEIFPNYVENAIEPSPENWKKYYQDNHSEQYDSGLEKLKKQFELEKQAINSITEQDLVDYNKAIKIRFSVDDTPSINEIKKLLFVFARESFG